MNKLKFIALSLLCTIFAFSFNSCRKEESNFSSSNSKEFKKNEAIVKRIKEAKLDINGLSKSFSDLAIFKTDFELVIFLDKVNNLSKKEKESLINNLPYRTLNNKVLQINKDIDLAKSEAELNSIVRNSNGLFWKNPDDEIAPSKLITRHSILPFLNEEMMILVGDKYFKYIGDYCLISKSKSDLISVNSVEKAEYIFVNPTKSEIKCNLTFRNQGSVTTDLRTDNGTAIRLEETHDPSWCKNDRRIKLEYAFPEDINTFNDPIFGTTQQHTLSRSVKIWALKKGIPCIWYTYPAEYTWNDFHFDYSFNTNLGSPFNGSVQWILPNETKQNTYDWVRGENIAFYISNFGQFYDVMWTKKKSSATHNGMNGKWIILNE